MSRLGDTIKQERVRAGLSYKQLAKKAGVAETFLMEIEAGTKIIADNQATRILKLLGRTAEMFADFEGKSDGMPTAVPPPTSAPLATTKVQAKEPTQPTDAWIDALGGILKAVPVLDASGKRVSERTLPTQSGRIESCVAEKVFYLVAPDNDMAGYRVRQGDRLLVLPATAIVDDKLMVYQRAGKYYVRKVKKIEGNRTMMSWYDFEPHNEMQPNADLTLIGRIVRIEIDM